MTPYLPLACQRSLWMPLGANTMTTLCFNLAKHPEIQEKIYQELCSVLDGPPILQCTSVFR